MRPQASPALLSQTALQDYVDCPRRYWLRYVRQLDFPSIESEPALENEKRLQAGQDFHQRVEQFWLGVPPDLLSGRTADVEPQRWWANFLASDFGLAGFEKRAEFTLSAPLGPFRLAAKYDLVASLPGDGIVIFDWKTYRRLPTMQSLAGRMQTRVYRALMVAAGSAVNGGQPPKPEQVELVYWFAEFPQDTIRLRYSARQFVLDWEMLGRLAEEIAAGAAFPMTSNLEQCGLCPYRSYCGRGVSAAQGREAETPRGSELGEAPEDVSWLGL